MMNTIVGVILIIIGSFCTGVTISLNTIFTRDENCVAFAAFLLILILGICLLF